MNVNTQGFHLSRLSTAGHALSLVASVYEFWLSFCFIFQVISVMAELSIRLGSSLYSLGADPTENTASNSSSLAIGGCLTIARISLTYLPAVTKQQLLSRLFRGLCVATGLYATILLKKRNLMNTRTRSTVIFEDLESVTVQLVLVRRAFY
jgi:hypothetical protein